MIWCGRLYFWELRDFRNHPIWKTAWMCSEVNKSVCTCGNNKWRFHKGFPVFVMIFYWVASCLTFQQLFIPYAHTCSSESMRFAMYNNLLFFSSPDTHLTSTQAGQPMGIPLPPPSASHRAGMHSPPPRRALVREFSGTYESLPARSIQVGSTFA